MTQYYCERCNIYYNGDDDDWVCPRCGWNGEQVSGDDAGDYDLGIYNRDE